MEKKKNLRRALLPAVATIALASTTLVGTTYAWFTTGGTATLGNIDMKVSDSEGSVQIAKADSTNALTVLGSGSTAVSWGTTIDSPVTVGENDRLLPVSTTGNNNASGYMTFASATVGNDNAHNITALTNKTMTDANNIISKTNEYVKFDLYFLNDGTSSKNMSLGTGTTVYDLSNGSQADTNLATTAIRIAFLKQQSVDTSTITSTSVTSSLNGSHASAGTNAVIYEPNATTHTNQAKADYMTYGGHSETEAAGVYTYKGVKALSSDATGLNLNRYTDTTYLGDTTTVTETTTTFFTLEAHSYSRISVYIWIEGQDADCTNAIATLNLRTHLVFTAA